MNIAIVDDLAEECSTAQGLILEYFKLYNGQNNITPVISTFISGEAFLNAYSPGRFQIVLLDIYMDKLTGIEVAERISSTDKECGIIFSTNSKDHMLDGYAVHALGYVLKPITEHTKALYKALSYALDKHSLDNTSIEITTKFSSNTIYYRNIVFIEIISRNLYVHLPSDSIRILGKYSTYKEVLLKDPRFLECYRNIIVNMDYVDMPLENDFILKNGKKLPISKRKKSEVMEKYMTYFIEGRGI